MIVCCSINKDFATTRMSIQTRYNNTTKKKKVSIHLRVQRNNTRKTNLNTRDRLKPIFIVANYLKSLIESAINCTSVSEAVTRYCLHQYFSHEINTDK